MAAQTRSGPTLESWIEGEEIEFVDEKAKADYQKRAKRFADAIRGDQPDRVPVNLLSTFYPVLHAGHTPAEAMNDAEILQDSLLTFVDDLDPDVFPWALPTVPSAAALETVEYQGFDWPGDGSAPETVYQAKEQDYMTVEDYDAFLKDPSDYLLRGYLPETFGTLGGMAQFPKPINLTFGIAGVHPFLLPFGLPPVREALETLLEAGEEAMAWQQAVGSTVAEIQASGYPQSFGGITLAPYDMLGDMLRGTRGIMSDLKRRPDQLLEAIERITPLAIENGIVSANVVNNPLVFIPLHKGADGFMSPAEFEEFYWPSLRAVIEALLDLDLVPWLFAEGCYETRLETISDLPEGDMVWHFQDIDMGRAKDLLGDQACIAGNVPTSLLNTREPEAVTEYCEDLLSTVGTEGFVLAPGVGLDEAKPENVEAMFQAVR
ncbi:MAG: uroporphyrinogen decarboxylase family protein [Halodesulfurarchaeum sp.]|nr:uroporphyrinogen decarboxylase family protein [Halodesulfurarchaeum sp.]